MCNDSHWLENTPCKKFAGFEESFDNFIFLTNILILKLLLFNEDAIENDLPDILGDRISSSIGSSIILSIFILSD